MFINTQSLEAIITMATNDCRPQIAVGILKSHMKFAPPVLPPMGTLGKFCEHLEKKKCYEDLYFIVNRLLQCRMAVCYYMYIHSILNTLLLFVAVYTCGSYACV